MFDLISGGPRHPFHDPTPAPVVVSIAGHAVALTLVVVLPLMYANGSTANGADDDGVCGGARQLRRHLPLLPRRRSRQENSAPRRGRRRR